MLIDGILYINESNAFRTFWEHIESAFSSSIYSRMVAIEKKQKQKQKNANVEK